MSVADLERAVAFHCDRLGVFMDCLPPVGSDARAHADLFDPSW
ncbi:MAG: hypothetical protein ABN502_10630 [Gammaproteobacteria bacterium]